MLVAHSIKGLLTKDDVKRMKSVYKKYVGGGDLRHMGYNADGSEIWDSDPDPTKRATLLARTATTPSIKPFNADAISKHLGDSVTYQNIIAGQQPGGMYDDSTTSSSSPNWKASINGTMPYLSNILNSMRKLPAPQAPTLEQTIDPNLVNFDAQRVELKRLGANTNAGLDYRVSNPAVRQALRGQTLANIIAGSNDIAGQEQNTNAGIKNQNAQANSLINARNVQSTNQFKNDLLSRSINQQRLNSENTADFSTKYGLNLRDNAMMDLENRKLDILPTLYKDSGVFDRNLLEQFKKEGYR
jgi:hypothetical protein